jgi:hypothetical protein
LKSCKTIWDFNLIQFVDFHIIQLLQIKSLHVKFFCYSFIYWQSLSGFCNHQIMGSIIIFSSSKISHIKYTWINLIVSFPIRRSPSSPTNAAMWEQCTLDNWMFWCGKVYYSNPIINPNFLQTHSQLLIWKYLLLLLLHWNLLI